MSTKYRAKKSDKASDKYKLKKHPLMLFDKPKDIEDYINLEVTDLDSAKEMLIVLAKLVCLHK